MRPDSDDLIMNQQSRNGKTSCVLRTLLYTRLKEFRHINTYFGLQYQRLPLFVINVCIHQSIFFFFFSDCSKIQFRIVLSRQTGPLLHLVKLSVLAMGEI